MDELDENEFECLYFADLMQSLELWCDSPDGIWVELVKKDLADIKISTDPDKHKPQYALLPTEFGRNALAKIPPLRRLAYCLEHGFSFNAQILVDELSKEELPVALASEDEWVSKQAVSRLKELEC